MGRQSEAFGSSRRKGTLVSELGFGLVDEVTNDLRQPLTVIRGCVGTVLENWDRLDTAEREEMLAAALRGADDLVVYLDGLEARLEAVERAGDGLAAPGRSPGPSLSDRSTRRRG
jgi:hypothetical protein